MTSQKAITATEVSEGLMKITAAVARGPSLPFSIEQLELEEPREDEVLVRIVGTGMCRTDIAIRDGGVLFPVVLGHEGAGVVESVGDRVTKVRPGDHVVLTFLSCGHCSTCRRGMPAYCENGFEANFGAARTDGSSCLRSGSEIIRSHFFGQSSFATYAVAAEGSVVRVRNDVPLELVGPLGCGLQTGAGAVLNSVDSRWRQTIAVFGAGSVGLSAIMAARLAGYTTIIAIDVHASRLQLASELGATHMVNAGDADVVDQVRGIATKGVDYAIEAAGRPETVRQAVDCLAVQGVCGVIGGQPMGTEVRLDANRILFGRTVRGILAGDSVPDLFIPYLIELFVAGSFPIDRLITSYNLEDINQAVMDSLAGRVVKPVLHCQQ